MRVAKSISPFSIYKLSWDQQRLLYFYVGKLLFSRIQNRAKLVAYSLVFRIGNPIQVTLLGFAKSRTRIAFFGAFAEFAEFDWRRSEMRFRSPQQSCGVIRLYAPSERSPSRVIIFCVTRLDPRSGNGSHYVRTFRSSYYRLGRTVSTQLSSQLASSSRPSKSAVNINRTSLPWISTGRPDASPGGSDGYPCIILDA